MKKPRNQEEFRINLGLPPRNRKERKVAAKMAIVTDEEVLPEPTEEEIAKKELDISRIVAGAKFKSKTLLEDSDDYREPVVESVEEHFYGNEGTDIVKVVTWNDARGKGHFVYTIEDFLEAFEIIKE